MGELQVVSALLIAGSLSVLFFAARHWLLARARFLLAVLTNPSGDVLKDADVGLAQVQLLSGWRRSSNVPGMMQAADPLRRRSLLVISEALDDFTDEMDLREYSRRTLAAWTGAGQILELHGPEERMVAGLKAVQTVALVADNRTLVKYLHTAIEGRRAFHQVVVWSPPSSFDKAVFERLLEGFAEVPGPTAMPRREHVHQPPSDYEVH